MANKYVLKIKEHKVQDGDTLVSIAQANGLTEQELEKFNWGTDNPNKINDYLRDKVGCKKKTADGYNYIFTSQDYPGIVYIPVKTPATNFSSNNTHTVTVKLPKVNFNEHKTVYGFDDFTVPDIPWKSVEKSKTDTVKAEITPNVMYAKVRFISSDTSKVTVSPDTATSGSQVLTVTGVDKGEAEIQATYNGTVIGRMKVKTFVRKTKTVAVRLVHEKNYKSKDISDAKIKNFLEKVYIQAVFEFKLKRLPSIKVNFDTITTTENAVTNIVTRTPGADKKVDVHPSGNNAEWMTAEMIKIRDECKDDGFDYNIFLVDNPSDGSLGYMNFNQRYGFVHVGTYKTSESTVAHELGHGAFGLRHTPGDLEDIMYNYSPTWKNFRLRKDQWDKINI
jgi:hypothetical protein